MRRRAVLPVVAIVLAVVVGLLTWRGSLANEWVVGRLMGGAVGLIALGIAARSERLVAVSTAPAMIGLVVGTSAASEVPWGRSLVAGCLWFLAVEAAFSSIEWGGGVQVASAALQRRLLDVSTVIAAGAGVGLAGLVVASVAPDRSIVVRAVVLAAVIAALIVGVRHIASVAPRQAAEDSDAATPI